MFPLHIHYGKIERNEADMRMSELNRVAEILETNAIEILAYGERNLYYVSENTGGMGNGVNMVMVGGTFNNSQTEEMQKQIDRLSKQVEELSKSLQAIQN